MTKKYDINKQVIENAKNTASKIENEEVRKRAFALNIGANFAAEFLNEGSFEIKNKFSLYKAPSFSNELELADIYIDNFRFDVRVIFEGDKFYIPKSHRLYDAAPRAYIVLRLEKNLSQAEVLGFVAPENLSDGEDVAEYKAYSTEILEHIKDFQEFVNTLVPQYTAASHDELGRVKELSASFIDEEISDSEKVFFIKHVISCASCREVFCELNDFDAVLSQLKNHEELLDDRTLSVLTGNTFEVDEDPIGFEELEELAELSDLSEFEEALEEKDEADTELDITPAIVPVLPVVTPLATPIIPIIPVADVDLTSLFDMADEGLVKEQQESEQEESEVVDEIEELPFLAQDEDVMLLEEANPEIEEPEELEESEEPIFVEAALEEPTFVEAAVEDADVEEPVIEELAVEETIEEIIEEEASDEVIDEIPAEEVKADITQDFDLLEDVHEEFNLKEEIEELTPIEFGEEHSEELFEEIQEEPVEEAHQEIADEMIFDDDISPMELEDLEVLDGLDSEDLITEHVELEQELPLEQSEKLNNEELNLEEDMPVLEAHDEILEEIQEETDVEIAELEEAVVEEPVVTDEILETEEAVVEESVVTEEILETEEASSEAEAPLIDSEIQNLLDDDLLAILAGGTEDPRSEVLIESDQEKNGGVSVEEEGELSGVAPQELYDEKESSEADLAELQDDEDETIQNLFDSSGPHKDGEEENVLDLNTEPMSASTVSATKKAIAAGVVALVLAGAGAGYWFMNNAKNQDASSEMTGDGLNNEVFDMQNKGTTGDASTPPAAQDINKAMTNSFSDKPAAITITKLSWQVSEKLVANPSVKEYLQIAGKNIQMNLQSDLANASDVTFNNSVKVSFEIAQDNTLKGIQMLESSGSDKIDALIESSLKNTLKYVPAPKLKDYKGDYFLTIVINF